MGKSTLIDHVDLLLLSVKAPLVDAVRATVCNRWREAADLWLQVSREPRYRTLSAACGLEATLRTGLYDLAQYFYLVDGSPSLPDFLVEPWRQSLPVRRHRARMYSGWPGANSDLEAEQPTRYLVSLRLYREAIRDVFRRSLFQTDRHAAVRLLAECYAALGEHEALLALQRSQWLYFGGLGARAAVGNAKACMAREALGPVKNTLEFVRGHPAGSVLAPLLDSPDAVIVPYE